MFRTIRSLLILGLAMLSCAQLMAQSSAPNFWTAIQSQQVILPANARQVLSPRKNTFLKLDLAAMRNHLRAAPMEFTGSHPLLVQVPDAVGQMRTLEVWESPVMAPELLAKFPEIRTYVGRPTDGSADLIRLGIGAKGFYSFSFRTDEKEDIETVRPVAEGQDLFYMAYRLEDLPNTVAPAGVLDCGVHDQHLPGGAVDTPKDPLGHFVADRGAGEPVKLKKYRAAISAKAEYTVFHGGTEPLVMSAIVEAVNFIAAIQERDFSLRLELVAGNEKLIYYDINTDPYSGTEVGEWMSQNQAVVTQGIGSANFDIGHVFSVYVEGTAVGIAGGRVCNNTNKARACSSAPQPNGEYFYLVTSHEMCHQMSGGHTWNICTADIAGQLAPNTAFEPGSGSTIMSYAGSCLSNDVQNSKNGYFHVGSIEQVKSFYTVGSGTCGTSSETDNNAPDVTILSPNNIYIPVRTPFKLDGIGTDPDGDVLTYTWEEYDLGPSVPLGQTTNNSPIFRSFPPSATGTSRTFPRLNNVVTNTTTKSELLPDTTREVKFRLTIRDNHPGAGGQVWGDIKLNATLAAGPFLVTYPNTNTVTWYGGESRVVTWDVANTDKAPVNCKKVNILLSTDNGFTYDFKLAEGVPNNGKCCIKVPDNVVDNLCRIRVEAADNVFFDISNAAFKMRVAEKPGFSLCTPLSQQTLCLPNGSISVNVGSILNFQQAVTLSVSGLPAGVTPVFSANPALPGTDVTLSLQIPPGQPESTFNMTITGTADTLSQSVETLVTFVSNDFSAVALQNPKDGAQGLVQSPTLIWATSPDANSYEVQVATSPSFETGTIKASSTNVTGGTYVLTVLLDKSQVYYWRVRPINECGPAAWTEPFVFGTVVESCGTFSANDLPKVISASGTPTVESVITINSGGIISDVNLKTIQGNHGFFKDLEVSLIGPDGTVAPLIKSLCGSYNGLFKFGFDDASSNAFSCPPVQTGAAFKPTSALNVFNGKNAAGAWTLRVKDNTTSSGGNLTGFQLEVCSGVALNAPAIVTNEVLQLLPGTNSAIVNTLLKAEDANNSAAQLTYTLVTVPKNGELKSNGGAVLVPGAQFTQADLDNGVVRYYHTGASTGDQFRFVVADGEGGFVTGTFLIKPLVGIFEPAQQLAFDLAPNPATESVRLSFSEGLRSDARVSLLNTAGQQLRSVTAPAGTLSQLIPVADLPKGVYIVAVQNNQASGVRKIVVQ